MGIIKPSVSFLPMNDIAGYLVENNKMATEEYVDKALDKTKESLTQCVAGDTTTAINSSKLGGIDADKYLTKDDAVKIEHVTDTMNSLYSNEIQNLREEVYHLKSKLSRNGFIDEDIAYEGFYDTFKHNNIKYETKICGIKDSYPALTNTLTIDDLTKIRDFEIGKCFVIVKTNTKEKEIVTVKNSDDTGVVEFYPSSALLTDKEVIELHKTYGIYYKDSFSFSEVTTGVDLHSQERYHMQSDDTMVAAQTIIKTNTGYAVSFKVPKTCVPNNQGALTSFSIMAKAIGNPGNLICYLLDESAAFKSGVLTPDFTSIEDAKNKDYLLATSNPIKAENAVNQSTLTFDFFNNETNDYPIIEDKRYLFIIECIDADIDNYWNIYFSYYKDSANNIDDLEKYNTSLMYQNATDDPSIQSLSIINDIDKYDLLFTIAVKDIADHAEFGNKEGLYTSKIVLPRPIDVSRARLSMRINREGCYYVDTVSADYTTFTLAKEDEYAYSNTDLRFDEDDIVIIGNQIGIIKKSTGNSIQLKEPLYLDYRIEKLYTKYNSSVKIPVYRVNYEASITPYLINWNDFDLTNKEFKSTKVSDALKLELTNVIPMCINKIGDRKSDRLLFEFKFGEDDNGLSKFANEFELQIKWKSKFNYNEINKPENIQNNYNELIGRIFELILTFDKIY